jgi:adenine-specific DNA-methyltransferase
MRIPDLFAIDRKAANDAAEATDRSGDPVLSQWFTPFWAAEELVLDALDGMGDVTVVEPSCGTGAFLSAIPASNQAFGVDIDPRMAETAERISGREVVTGDFATVDLGGRTYHAVIGNPPFEMSIVERFLERAHRDLPEGGLVALVLPAYAFQTPSRVTRWMGRFSIDVNIIPRTIFPGLSKPLVWAKYRKASERRFSGMMLFNRTRDVESMKPSTRAALEAPGTWREAVRTALESLGGEASVSAICEAIVPARRCSAHWRPKIRQTLQRGFRPLGEGRWSLRAAA